MARQYRPSVGKYGRGSSGDSGSAFGHTGGNQSMRSAGARAGRAIDNIDDVLNEDPIASSPSYAGSPSQVLRDQENDALGRRPVMPEQRNALANPKSSISRGGLGLKSVDEAPKSNVQRGGLGGTRKSLNDKEGDGLYKPSKDKEEGDGPLGGIRKFVGSGVRMRKRLAIAGVISGMLGGGGMFGLFGPASAVFGIMQEGELLTHFHLQEKEDQGDSRTSHLIRNLKNLHHLASGNYERTRLGVVGNHIADRVEAKMESQGFKVEYDGLGKFTGYTIDPQRLSSADYPDLEGRDPEAVSKYFEQKLGAKNNVAGAKIFVPNPKGYFKEKRLYRKVLRMTGFHWSSPLAMRTAGVRMNFGFHWMKHLTGQSLDEKYRAFAKNLIDKVRGKSTAPTGTATEKDKNGNDVQSADTQAASEAEQLGSEASQEAAAGQGKTVAMEKLKSFVNSKFTSVGGGVLGFLCFLKLIGDNIDDLNQKNVIGPMVEIAAQTISIGDEIQSNRDVDMNQVGWFSQLQYDSKNKNSWYDAMSIGAESGRPLGGLIDISPDAKIDPKGNLITQIIAGIPGLTTACDVLDNAVVSIVTGIVSLVVAPAQTLIGLLVGVVAIQPLVDYVSNVLSANVVPALASGAMRGNFANYGARLMANDLSLSRGGLPLTAADAQSISVATAESDNYDFKQQSLAYRMFSPSDPKSFVAQVIRTQSPNPADNYSNMAVGLLNMGKTFGTTIGSIFSKSVGAEPYKGYDYGFDDFAFTPAEMNDPNLESPYDNGDKVADILDSQKDMPMTNALGNPNADNYIARAKTCFGVDIDRANVTIDGKQTVQYSIKPPVTGQVPTYKTVLDKDNKCLEGTAYGQQQAMLESGGKSDGKVAAISTTQGGTPNWTRIRMFIFDSQMANAAGCIETDQNDDIGKQACIDIGLYPSNNSGSTAGGGYSGQAIPTGDLPGWKQIFADDFNVNAALGSWGSECDANKVVYTGTGPLGTTQWNAYPQCYKDTYDKRAYRSDQVLDVGNGNLRFHLHQVDGQPAGANPSPRLPAANAGVGTLGQSQYQTYGRYIARFMVEPHSGDMKEYYLAWLLWPPNDGDYQSAESDYPEGSLADADLQGFHHSSGGQESVKIPGYSNHDWKQWHNYIQEWEPGVRRYYIDNSQPFVTSNPVWSGPERWQMQTETKGGGNSDGYIYVDWVAVYCHIASGCKIGE